MTRFQSPLLAKSSIVLCTHHVHAVNVADQIVLLSRGAQAVTGGLDEESLLEAAQQGDAAEVSFCGTAAEFRERFPKLVASKEAVEVQLTRQTSEDATPKAKKDVEAGQLAPLAEVNFKGIGEVSG